MIKQVRFSKSVKFFKPGFCKYWDVVDYHDVNAPCLFVGVYNMDDVAVLNAHKGLKIIWQTGSIKSCFSKVSPVNAVVKLKSVDKKEYESIKKVFKTKEAYFPIKDFSGFTKPVPLGNKIYCYLGHKKGRAVMGGALIDEIKKYVPFEIIEGYLGHDMEYVKEHYYNHCFVNIKPNVSGGFTTATELAYMGRWTISNANAPFCKPYDTILDIVKLIFEESEKIGTIQPSCVGDLFDTGKEWKNEEFWTT